MMLQGWKGQLQLRLKRMKWTKKLSSISTTTWLRTGGEGGGGVTVLAGEGRPIKGEKIGIAINGAKEEVVTDAGQANKLGNANVVANHPGWSHVPNICVTAQIGATEERGTNGSSVYLEEWSRSLK